MQYTLILILIVINDRALDPYSQKLFRKGSNFRIVNNRNPNLKNWPRFREFKILAQKWQISENAHISATFQDFGALFFCIIFFLQQNLIIKILKNQGYLCGLFKNAQFIYLLCMKGLGVHRITVLGAISNSIQGGARPKKITVSHVCHPFFPSLVLIYQPDMKKADNIHELN